MPVFSGDRVSETSTTTGTGNITLAGAASGFRAFSALFATNTDWFYYTLVHQSAAEWEAGIGRLTGATTLERVAVISSSNSNALVSFSAGTKNIFLSPGATGVSHPASMYFGTGADGDVTISSGTTTFGGMLSYQNLTISGTAVLVLRGYPLIVSGVLDLTEASTADMIRPSATSGIALAGSDATSSTGGVAGLSSNSSGLWNSTSGAGGAGGAGGTAAGGVGANAAEGAGHFGGSRSAGGLGGTGSGGAGGAGGSAGSTTTPPHRVALLPHQFAPGSTGLFGARGGSGGGGGGGDGVASGGGGGGGAGAGVVQIFARVIRVGGSTAAGIIQLRGGAGGGGFAPGAGNRGGGAGGGGGGGGVITIVTEAIIGTSAANALQADGGAGGTGAAGFGSGTAGAGGSGGSSGQISVLQLAKGKAIFASNQQVAGGAASGTTGGAGAICQETIAP